MNHIYPILPSVSDGCAYYRSIGPLAQLRQFGWSYSLQALKPTWGTMAQFDVCFAQRPHTTEHLIAIEMASHIMPIWLDFDDLVWDVPKSNPHYDRMMQPEVLALIDNCVELANVVTVSTPFLLGAFRKRFPNTDIRLIRNAHNDYWFPLQPQKPLTPCVFWRGTDTHQQDLLEFADVIAQAHKRFQNVPFCFMGAVPWPLQSRIPYKRILGMGILDYLSFLQEFRPAVTIVPLADHPFNRAKSDIAAIEVQAFGGRSLVPNWDSWIETPSTLHYETPDMFRELLEDLLQQLPFCGAKAITRIPNAPVLLSQTNSLRLWVLSDLLKMQPKPHSWSLPL